MFPQTLCSLSELLKSPFDAGRQLLVAAEQAPLLILAPQIA